MRRQFIETLTEIAKQDERIWLLTADLGYSVIEPFADTHPNRFINVGCAEQNMIGIAMGMASSQLFPFCYSITTFLTMRPYEFIRHACHQRLPIRLVGIGRHKEYEHNGFTHWPIESPAIMRALPNLEIIIPTPTDNIDEVLRLTWCLRQPIYYNLQRG